MMARTKRMRGFNVLHPFGWDAFGLPAENAAIKTGIHPETSTLDNIAHMKGQLQRLGISYAWEREIATCLPEYYKLNQWIFLKMFERGLAYRRRSTVNWCPKRQDRARQRAGDRRRLLALRHAGRRRAISSSGSSASPRTPTSCSTALDDADGVAREGRRRCSGTGSGARKARASSFRSTAIRRRDRGLHDAHRHDLRRDVRAARARASAGRAVRRRESPIRRRSAQQVADVPRAGPRRRALTGDDREGRLRHRPHARSTRSPASTVPIWIANFVLGEYGTGAIMAVPAHDQRDFEFARKYSLPIRVVVQPDGDAGVAPTTMTEAHDELRARWSTPASTPGRTRRRCITRMIADAETARHRQGRGAVPAEGLGHLAPALLGHADPDDLLREGRRRAGAGRAAAGRAAEGRRRSPAAAIRRWRRCRSS